MSSRHGMRYTAGCLTLQPVPDSFSQEKESPHLLPHSRGLAQPSPMRARSQSLRKWTATAHKRLNSTTTLPPPQEPIAPGVRSRYVGLIPKLLEPELQAVWLFPTPGSFWEERKH